MRASARIPLGLVALCLLAFPAGARAGELSRDGGTVVFTEVDADLSQNDVFVGVFSGAPGEHQIWDGNEPITDLDGNSGCTSTVSGFWKCGSADFRIILGGGSDFFRASAGASHTASVSPVAVFGGPGVDVIVGGDGNDVFDGGAGADNMSGGIGLDLVTYAGRTAGVTVDLGQAGADDGSPDDGADGARDTIDPASVEGVIGGSGPDNLRGNAGANQLDGGPGPDTLDALGGQDTVLGGSGFDTIEARDGTPDSVDCGPDEDSAMTDAVDTRANCDSAPPPEPTGSGGSGGTTTTPELERILVDVGFGYSASRRSTRLRRLFVRDVPVGSRLKVKCRTRGGRRCAKTRDLSRAGAGGDVRLRSFEGKPLPAGAKLTIQVTHDGMVGAVERLTIRSVRAPKQTTLCLPPGGSARTAC